MASSVIAHSEVNILQSTSDAGQAATSTSKFAKGSRFWLSMAAVIVCNFLGALDVTIISTALPTITDDLHGGDDFVWVGTAYGLAAAAIMPFTARLADTIGRRPIMMICVAFFFIGSALAGSAQSMNWLIAARGKSSVQGVGGGGIINLASIILSDLVPLAERGLYQGLLVMTYAIASAVGPSIGGSLAEKATWRWLFYINLPLAGIAFSLVALFLRVRTPPGTLREKLARIDWLGTFLAIAGTTLVLVALTWGGIQYPWGSAHVLAPLIIGSTLLGGFLLFEKFVPAEPTIPLDIMANRTSFCGYLGTFFHGLVTLSVIYYLPVYFQACKGATPIQSSVKVFATTFIVSPFSIVCGVMVKATNKYRPMNYIGWALMVTGAGLLSLLKDDSRTKEWVGFQIVAAAGIGIVWASTVFPILAPLPVTRVAPALAFYNFSRVFAQVSLTTTISTVATHWDGF
ncbi:hypothetical protein NUW54_g7027 [Trametes sanguinea]|uniref:Uncharacterized protein n=1 Tax=Trametes sanguinea TaxID=158606 RepID=A0ACC1PS89_9APHY|nr:hypothetical protein NUW54_g7027 [Trametes sanguinea]